MSAEDNNDCNKVVYTERRLNAVNNEQWNANKKDRKKYCILLYGLKVGLTKITK